MANNPYVNKVQTADGTTIIDISDTTAVASDVASGKYFYTASGAKVQGTGSGGGGGLEYETGTYTPAEDINTPTISFANIHSIPPSFISISDVSGLGVDSNSALFFSLIDTYRLTGSGWPYSASALRYGFLGYAYLGTSSASSSTIMMQHSSDETSAQSSTYYRYWATESGFKPSANNTSRFWRAGRTYKWIAVWAPTT